MPLRRRKIPNHEQANSEPPPHASVPNRETGMWLFTCRRPACRKVLGKPRTERKILDILFVQPKLIFFFNSLQSFLIVFPAFLVLSRKMSKKKKKSRILLNKCLKARDLPVFSLHCL